MRKIVVITTLGTAKRDFVNMLQRETDGSVALVVIQKPKVRPLIKRLENFFKKVRIQDSLSEIFFLVRFLVDKSIYKHLELAKQRTLRSNMPEGYLAPVIEVDSVNSEEVHVKIEELKPDVIAVWGGSIIKPYIIESARTVVNIHTGFCPYYRGTNCHFNAILNDDLTRLGTTLHQVVKDVDAGDIYEIITTDHDRPFVDIFRDLNDRSFEAYVKLVKDLSEGKERTKFPQDVALGHNYLLKEWTYKKRYETAKKMEVHDAKYRKHL